MCRLAQNSDSIPNWILVTLSTLISDTVERQHQKEMATTTLKTQAFVTLPLRECGLLHLPGVGPATAEALEKAGLTTASQVMGHFLLVDGDEDKFIEVLVKMGVRQVEAKKTAIGCAEKYKTI